MHATTSKTVSLSNYSSGSTGRHAKSKIIHITRPLWPKKDSIDIRNCNFIIAEARWIHKFSIYSAYIPKFHVLSEGDGRKSRMDIRAEEQGARYVQIVHYKVGTIHSPQKKKGGGGVVQSTEMNCRRSISVCLIKPFFFACLNAGIHRRSCRNCASELVHSSKNRGKFPCSKLPWAETCAKEHWCIYLHSYCATLVVIPLGVDVVGVSN